MSIVKMTKHTLYQDYLDIIIKINYFSMQCIHCTVFYSKLKSTCTFSLHLSYMTAKMPKTS